MTVVSLWARIPVIVRAMVAGLTVGAAVTVPWAILAGANLQRGSAVPWAVLLTLPYLWLWWKWVSGEGWPRSTAAVRRTNLRARAVSDEVWSAALVAGVLGIATSLIVLNVTNRLASVPQQPIPDVSRIPLTTLLPLHFMGSAVAGIVEEASFRGYMQAPIERRHGPGAAILITGTVFGFAHLTHPGVIVMMPFYLTLAATYGAMAYLTNSVVPGMVLHGVGDALGGIAALTRGSQTSSLPLPSLDAPGSNSPLWLPVLAALIAGGATVWAFHALASVARRREEKVLISDVSPRR